MLVKSLFVLLTISVLLMPLSKSPQTPPYDLLIKGGRFLISILDDSRNKDRA